MGDFTSYGGSDEENAEIRKLNTEVVSRKPSQATPALAYTPLALLTMSVLTGSRP